jgi:hypothetical protein
LRRELHPGKVIQVLAHLPIRDEQHQEDKRAEQSKKWPRVHVVLLCPSPATELGLTFGVVKLEGGFVAHKQDSCKVVYWLCWSEDAMRDFRRSRALLRTEKVEWRAMEDDWSSIVALENAERLGGFYRAEDQQNKTPRLRWRTAQAVLFANATNLERWNFPSHLSGSEFIWTGPDELLSCFHSLASVSQNSASASHCSASFLARMARSRDMISNLSNWSLVVIAVTYNFAAV